MNRYQEAKELYAGIGVDVDKAIETLKNIPISLHCWQGDDVLGFLFRDIGLSGGIQTTGNYPGRATTPAELRAVFLPGKSHGQRSLVGYSPWRHRVGRD